MDTNVVPCENSKLINESDNLKLTDLKIPNDILFPDELNQYLQGQLQFLLRSNGMLERKIKEQQNELKEKEQAVIKLTSKVSEYEKFTKPSDGNLSINPSYIMSAKIVELSKRLKDKNVEVESLKTKLSKSNQKIVFLENNRVDVTNNKQEENKDPSEQPEIFLTNSQEEVKIVQDKLLQTNKKLFEVKNANVELQNQIKVANKLLQQEIGDSFSSIQNWTINNNNWRGRAQQILYLQQKNSELQDKIASLNHKDCLLNMINKPDNRKIQIDQLQKELANVKFELEETKKKLNGARARSKVLENECSTLKYKINSMASIHESDEKMIKMLQNQITSVEESSSEIKKEKQSNLKKVENENKNLKAELERQNMLIENIKKSLDEKNIAIKEMKNEMSLIKKSECNSSRSSHMPYSLDSPNRINVLEAEVKKLLELLKTQNARIDEERNAHTTTKLNYKKERQKAAKLELKLSRIELENSLNSNMSHNYAKSNSKLSSRSNEESFSSIDIENLKNNLELAEENVSVLRSKLDLIQKEKDLDLQRFSSILSETSSMLLKFNSPQTESVTSS